MTGGKVWDHTQITVTSTDGKEISAANDNHRELRVQAA